MLNWMPIIDIFVFWNIVRVLQIIEYYMFVHISTCLCMCVDLKVFRMFVYENNCLKNCHKKLRNVWSRMSFCWLYQWLAPLCWHQLTENRFLLLLNDIFMHVRKAFTIYFCTPSVSNQSGFSNWIVLLSNLFPHCTLKQVTSNHMSLI